MTPCQPVSLADKLAQFSDHYNPRIVGNYNGNEIRVVKIKGDFTWHSHADTDELFFVVSGKLGIEFRDGVTEVGSGEFIVVPKGVEHRPFADTECEVMLMNREGEPNTGSNPSALTREKLEAI